MFASRIVMTTGLDSVLLEAVYPSTSITIKTGGGVGMTVNRVTDVSVSLLVVNVATDFDSLEASTTTSCGDGLASGVALSLPISNVLVVVEYLPTSNVMVVVEWDSCGSI